MMISPAYVGEPEGNGSIERIMRNGRYRTPFGLLDRGRWNAGEPSTSLLIILEHCSVK
jgi:hypothetical protein